MRIVIVVPVFPQLSETFIAAKVLGLVDRGIDVHVVCTTSAEDQWDAFGIAHPVHRLRNRVHTTPPVSFPRSLPALAQVGTDLVSHHTSAARRYLRSANEDRWPIMRRLFIDEMLIKLEPDVIHFEFGSGAIGRGALRERLDATVTASFRGSDLNVAGLESPRRYDEVWTNIDRVHVLGQSLADAAKRCGAPSSLPIEVIPPAVDLNAIGPLTIQPTRERSQPLRILSVGRMHWTKGYQYALEAVADLRRRGVPVHYRIVGGGPLLGAVAFWRHQLGLDDVVELTGPISPAQVIEHQRWADVFLHAAVTEGFCNAVLEAQALALPVVCTDAGGLPENVNHGVTGFVVPRREPNAMADAMAALAQDPDLSVQMGTAGRRRVETHFQISDQLDAWERFYTDAVADRRKGVPKRRNIKPSNTTPRSDGLLVSVVIPARQLDAYLEATLASIAAQQLPPGVTTEVVVALGTGAGGAPRQGNVSFIDNPTGTIPDGLNQAITQSTGAIVARVDARCVLQADHIARVVAGLDDSSVGCVGGAALVLDRGLFGSTYAVAFNSMLLGPTVFRYRRTSGSVDAVYLGAWRREELDQLGGFDPLLIRNQDNELAERVRASGKKVWYDAGLVVGYYNARDLREALAHHHEFGLWRMMQRDQGQQALTPRHITALGGLAAAATITVAALSCRRTRPAVVGAAALAYASAAVLSWHSATRLRSARVDITGAPFHPVAPLLAPALATGLNGAWLAGLVKGAFRRNRSDDTPRSNAAARTVRSRP